MAFRTNRQRRAVMAKLHASRNQQQVEVKREIKAVDNEMKVLAAKAKRKGFVGPVAAYEAFRLGVDRGRLKAELSRPKK